ncbi:MAG: isocitrate/isopropylmalate family dehydrogenase [Alphaproteobacteria bacterium]|jgi:isocitrate dehydrogenase
MGKKYNLKAPKMVYILGEEMTRYGMELVLEKWVKPFVDTSSWQFFDLSVKHRDETKDKVLKDVIEAGKKVKSVFKEPTITPTDDQKKEFGLKNTLGSPNGAMRKGWNGITISRDTIHVDGLKQGFKHKVIFDRQAIGGEYFAGAKIVGKGKSKTIFYPENGGEPVIVDERELKDSQSALVTYDNPYDSTEKLAHYFFDRCLQAKVIPYIVTKKTVFKWQEPFWQIMKKVFDAGYKEKFKKLGLLDHTKGELAHLISDSATMQIVKWTDGGFGMVSHNYDGDVLTDLISQIHGSPGFITSVLTGVADDGSYIKEFEASHGTVSDMYKRKLHNEETSLNPVGMIEALASAMEHAGKLESEASYKQVKVFTDAMMDSLYKIMMSPKGTRDIAGKTGSTTEVFVDLVAGEIAKILL